MSNSDDIPGMKSGHEGRLLIDHELRRFFQTFSHVSDNSITTCRFQEIFMIFHQRIYTRILSIHFNNFILKIKLRMPPMTRNIGRKSLGHVSNDQTGVRSPDRPVSPSTELWVMHKGLESI